MRTYQVTPKACPVSHAVEVGATLTAETERRWLYLQFLNETLSHLRRTVPQNGARKPKTDALPSTSPYIHRKKDDDQINQSENQSCELYSNSTLWQDTTARRKNQHTREAAGCFTRTRDLDRGTRTRSRQSLSQLYGPGSNPVSLRQTHVPRATQQASSRCF